MICLIDVLRKVFDVILEVVVDLKVVDQVVLVRKVQLNQKKLVLDLVVVDKSFLNRLITYNPDNSKPIDSLKRMYSCFVRQYIKNSTQCFFFFCCFLLLLLLLLFDLMKEISSTLIDIISPSKSMKNGIEWA